MRNTSICEFVEINFQGQDILNWWSKTVLEIPKNLKPVDQGQDTSTFYNGRQLQVKVKMGSVQALIGTEKIFLVKFSSFLVFDWFVTQTFNAYQPIFM